MATSKFTALAALLCVTLAACGGGGSVDSAPLPSQQSTALGWSGHRPATSLAFIGNSLTLVPEWGRGIASSDISLDYVHLTATATSLPFTATNFASLERNPADPVNHIDMTTPVGLQIAAIASSIDSTTAVVVQLGDNAPVPADFAVNYAQLIANVKTGNRLVCISTWWESIEKDSAIKAACEGAGGKYVFIGDIRIRADNRDAIDGPQYSNQGVQDHPHDWSMVRIAERVVAALR